MKQIKNLFQIDKLLSSKINRETIWAFISKLIASLSGLLFVVLIPNISGVEVYGQFSLILTYITFSLIIIFDSISIAIKKELGKYKTRTEGYQAFMNGLVLKMFFAIFGSIIILVISKVLKLKIIQNNIYEFFLLMIFMSLWSLTVNTLEILHDLKSVLYIYIVEYSVKICSLFLFFYFTTFNLKKILFSFILGYLLSFIFSLYVLYKKFKIKKINLDTIYIKKIINRSLYLILSTISFMILTKIDLVMISQMLNYEAVGYYSIASDYTKKLTILSLPIISGIIPYFASKMNKKLYKLATKRLLLINIAISLGLIVFSKIIITSIYGTKFNEVIIIMQILSFFPLLSSIHNFNQQILVLADKTKTIFYLGFFATIINIILNYIFIQNLGIYGAPIATMITYSIWLLLTIKKNFNS